MFAEDFRLRTADTDVVTPLRWAALAEDFRLRSPEIYVVTPLRCVPLGSGRRINDIGYRCLLYTSPSPRDS